MIEKMKFLSITGPKADIDRMMDKYLSKYEIHLENALSELKTVRELTPYIEEDPYKQALDKAAGFCRQLGMKAGLTGRKISIDEAKSIVNDIDGKLSSLLAKREELVKRQKEDKEELEKVAPFKGLDFDLDKILKFKFIKFRFGKLTKEDYQTFEKYVSADMETIFYPCNSDRDHVWGIFFVPASEFDKTDTIYSSLHFESTFLPGDLTGSPQEVCTALGSTIAAREQEIADCDHQMQKILADNAENVMSAYETLQAAEDNFNVRKLAACTREGHNMFYILCGWMSKKDAARFQKDIDNDDTIFCIVEEDHSKIFSTPPTKLKNPKIFRPFEMFVRMYGLPAYNEFDPTIFVALTYTFIFGCMFGDAGQGICLLVGGALLYKLKKMDLAAIISMAGIFSTIFGVLYGSFFGFENVIPALWLKPMEATVTLPLVGTLNTVLVISVAFGMGLILLSMCFNIFNGIREKDIGKIVFDTNGLLGFIFYGSAVAVIVLFMTGHALPAGILLFCAFGIPLILLLLKEPIVNALEKKQEKLNGIGMYLVQSVFELFEVVLSYLTNTISFVRIGAFALSHAGMMQVVLMLAGAENGGSPSWPVIVIGNIFVAGMEGLIVGIHVLRLEYYEMFSRFFQGSGREFKPYKKK